MSNTGEKMIDTRNNTGSENSGDWNSGYRNSGGWNACDYETGYFNTEQSETIRVFNKECSRKDWANADKPSFLYFDLCTWIPKGDMTGEEKKADPEFHVRGGYLKILGYKEAFQESWNSADEEDRAKLFKLPNFDAEVFKEISGIHVTAKAQSCAGKVVEIDGKKYKLTEV